MYDLTNTIRLGACVVCMCQLAAAERAQDESRKGLRIEFFGSPQFERPQETAVAPGPEIDGRLSRGNDWAARFSGVNMLVGFTYGQYQLNKNNHNITGREFSWLARSTDMGLTWTAYDPDGYVGDFGDTPERKTLTNAIDFSHPQFAMRVVGTAYHGARDERAHYFYSYDAGKTWNGPYAFGANDIRNWPELTTTLGDVVLTPRTDYIVEGKNSLLVFMSVKPKGSAMVADRLFCMRTTDGGRTFNWVGWVVPPSDPHRAVMSQSIRLNSGKLISAIRRRSGERPFWVDAYVSTDNGQTWSFLSKVGDTGGVNGNPPALSVTGKGRLAAVFGNRNESGAMMVVYSDDEGGTWSEPAILRDGFASEDMETNDLGYPRLLRREDGKMAAFYYWSTTECLHHIAVTIWDADN